MCRASTFVIAHVIAYMAGHVIAYESIRLCDNYIVDIGAWDIRLLANS